VKLADELSIECVECIDYCTKIYSKQHCLRVDVSLCDGIKRRDEFEVNRPHKSYTERRTSNA
jgi:hypothetical protein